MAAFGHRKLTTGLSLDAASELAAELIAGTIRRRLDESGEFHLLVTGGRSPARIYERLAESALDWRRVNFFWSDERAVSPDHPESNYRLVRQHLLDRCMHDPSRVHRMPGELRPLSAAAESYEKTLELALDGASFDLALLGMGEDGHVASLFPGTAEVLVRNRSVVYVTASPKPPPQRLSLTIPRLAASSEIIVFTTGSQRGQIARAVLSDPQRARERWPVALLPMERTRFIVADD